MVEDKKTQRPKTHNLFIENRKKLSVTGVVNVESFNEENIVLETDLGILFIRGQNLHIGKLNVDSSDMFLEGEIQSCEYLDVEASRNRDGGFWSKLFK